MSIRCFENFKPFAIRSSLMAGCKRWIILLLCVRLLQIDANTFANDQSSQTNVCIYAATPAGIAAAVSAAKAGHDVTLVEPSGRIGGLVTSGLSHTDFRSFESLSGFFWEFSNRVKRHYEDRYGKDSDQAIDCFGGTHGEPSVNLEVLSSWMEEYPRINLRTHLRLNDLRVSASIGGRRRIESIRCSDTRQAEPKVTETIAADVFIDASYEGDLMAMAGEPYHIGRESRDQYGEPMAGDASGHADGQVQGYNLRLIMTDVAANRRDPVRPDRYRREDFVGVLRLFAAGKVHRVFSSQRDGIYRAHLPRLPNGKADVNDTPHAAVRLSMPDINDDYPEANDPTRAKIVDEHYRYNLGLLYFLQTDPAVPTTIQQDAKRWGFCKDEFSETDGISPALYIREARRMIGQHVFTGRDTRPADGDARSVFHADSIAIGDYVHNCHGTGRTGTRFDGEHTGEFYAPVPPYQIPYGVIVPTRSTNLLVPVACSASHFGFGALRLEPIWSSLGQAAGWAASQSIQDNIHVQDVDVQKLQSRLHADRAATIYVSDVGPDHPRFAEVQRTGMRGELHGKFPAGQPKPKPIMGQYCEAFPGHSFFASPPQQDRDTE